MARKQRRVAAKVRGKPFRVPRVTTKTPLALRP
jgi:hypothetical protein